MGNLFGKSKARPSRVTEQDKAVLQLKRQRDVLKQYQRRLQSQMDNERLLAKRLLAEGKKDKALLLFRKKKFAEKMLEKTDRHLDNIAMLTHDVEFAQIEVRLVEGLRVGNEALKSLNAALSVEAIEQLMDDTKEAVEKQQEINALLCGGIGDEAILTPDDDEDILRELEELVEPKPLQQEDKPTPIESEPNLPNVPTEEPTPLDTETVPANKGRSAEKRKMEPVLAT